MVDMTQGFVVASVGVRRLRWRRSAREESLFRFVKGTIEAAKDGRPEGPRKAKGRTGRKQAIGFLRSLGGKTLKHTKTTEAENQDR